MGDWTVMTYNLKGLGRDVEALVRVIREVSPDVLGVQEPARWWWGGRRLRALADAAGMRVVVARRGARTTALLVREDRVLQVEAAQARRLPWWGRRRRGTRWPTRRGYCSLELAGMTVHSVHLAVDPWERARHVARVAEGVRRRGADRAVVLADLNEPPGGPAWRCLQAEGLADAATTAARPSVVALAPGAATGAADAGAPGAVPESELPTFSTDRPRRRIDAVLVGAGLRVERSWVVAGPDARRASDHFPVVAVLGLTAGSRPPGS